MLGTLISHSSPQNLTWASQFAEQVRAGVLYPRWMPKSFDGLGSPAFYFYPPLPFWIDALVSIVTANALSVPYRLAVSTTVILFLSGLAMHAWLLKISGKRTAALIGAIAYMAAPYHLFDTYTRGAFAEITAYAVLPVVVLALRLTLEKARWGLPLLALAYAALLLSHLPTALLVLDHGDPGLRAVHHALARACCCAVPSAVCWGSAFRRSTCCRRWSCNPGSRPTSSGPRSIAPATGS